MQLEVTATVHDNREDMLVLMPTGSGKTKCVLLPAYMEEFEKATIILVPFVALIEEYKSRCRTLGLALATWETRHTAAQVYVFSADAVNRDGIDEIARKLQQERRLARLVIDEAHVTTTCDDFRPALDHMRYVLDTLEMVVCRVLLSAIVPPRDRAQTICMHGLSSA